MTRDSLISIINIKEELISLDKPNRKGSTIIPTKITIHNTSNNGSGANAQAHSKFVRNTGYYWVTNKEGIKTKNWVSWHYTVDDKMAIRHLPHIELSLHAGKEANNQSISIEVCMHKEINQKEANEKAAQLVALLCHDLSLSIENVVTHKHWTGKNCPIILLQEWDSFVALANDYLVKILKSDFITEQIDIEKNERSHLKNLNTGMCWEDEVDLNENVKYNKPKLLETYSDSNDSFIGYDSDFLQNNSVLLPVLDQSNEKSGFHEFIHHHHLTIYFNNNRKLPLYCACNFNKEKFISDVSRGDFDIDPKIDKKNQIGQEFYFSKTINHPTINNQNVFDRGHVVSRRYTQWGESKKIAKRNADETFYFTNIAPQTRELNQQEWELLEAYIIEYNQLNIKKVSIFSGCLLRDNDPIATYIDFYTNQEMKISIPTIFWKVVFYEVQGELRKIAFMMSQSASLNEMTFISFSESITGVDPFVTINKMLKPFIVNSSLIEKHTGLNFSKAMENYKKIEPLELILPRLETNNESLMSQSNLNKYL
jgi:N-acetylmuramoyl-L-alanine amidase